VPRRIQPQTILSTGRAHRSRGPRRRSEPRRLAKPSESHGIVGGLGQSLPAHTPPPPAKYLRLQKSPRSDPIKFKYLAAASALAFFWWACASTRAQNTPLANRFVPTYIMLHGRGSRSDEPRLKTAVSNRLSILQFDTWVRTLVRTEVSASRMHVRVLVHQHYPVVQWYM
jgi:hypothetical protein